MATTYNDIVILTGAGISAESGIKTFRDSNGLWENHSIEEVASPEGFSRNPELVYRFYNARRKQLYDDETVTPNPAHEALATLEKNFSGSLTLITQNVDNLHERGGSHSVLHMHGRLDEMRCNHCGAIHSAPIAFDRETLCPSCNKKGHLRPNIVWFGEMPFHLDEAAKVLAECDLFLCIGTSGLVYPAAQFVSMTGSECHRVEFNLNQTPSSSLFNQTIHGPAGTTVPDFVNNLLQG